MDLADEIAYAAHDLEDALSFGMISLGEIVHEFSISDKFKDAYPTMTDIAKEAQNVAMKASRSGTSEEYAIVLKKELTSMIVNILCSDIGLVDGCLGYKRHAKLAEGLKNCCLRQYSAKRYSTL